MAAGKEEIGTGGKVALGVLVVTAGVIIGGVISSAIWYKLLIWKLAKDAEDAAGNGTQQQSSKPAGLANVA